MRRPRPPRRSPATARDRFPRGRATLRRHPKGWTSATPWAKAAAALQHRPDRLRMARSALRCWPCNHWIRKRNRMASASAEVVTRFAPSPTGFLHIGGARTALFNWLYARHHGGKALLRIEDTDRKRSTTEAIDAIIDGLSWLGLDYDEPPIFQSERAPRHAEVAFALLEAGYAYKCYATPEELEAMREAQRAAKQPLRYDGRWRDRDPADAAPGAPFVIRLKTPNEGETAIEDLVQGRVTV